MIRYNIAAVLIGLALALPAAAQDYFTGSADDSAACYNMDISIDVATREQLRTMKAACQRVQKSFPDDQEIQQQTKQRIKDIDNAFKKRKS